MSGFQNDLEQIRNCQQQLGDGRSSVVQRIEVGEEGGSVFGNHLIDTDRAVPGYQHLQFGLQGVWHHDLQARLADAEANISSFDTKMELVVDSILLQDKDIKYLKKRIEIDERIIDT